MSGYSVELSTHLKQLRTSRKLTLNELAEKSGISRATLSRIEKAEASPTADTLGALSSAYHLPISALLTPLENTFEPVVRFERQPVWQDELNGFIRRNVSPPAADLSMELIEGQLRPNQCIAYDKPSMLGQEHHLMMLEGELLLTVGSTEYRLNAGDCVRYKLFESSRYRTLGQAAKYVIALSKGI